jgi:hypothetical protein
MKPENPLFTVHDAMPMPSEYLARFAERLESAGVPVWRRQFAPSFSILSALPK